MYFLHVSKLALALVRFLSSKRNSKWCEPELRSHHYRFLKHAGQYI